MTLRKNKQPPVDSRWLRCPVCQKKTFLYRSIEKTYQCRSCGSVFVANWQKKQTRIVRYPGADALDKLSGKP